MALDSVSLSSDDDIPLNMVGALHAPDPVDLTAQIVENCEFCEKVSNNKYDALVHNAKHIIIPLLKQEVHQCTLCLFYFTSRYKLKHHLRNKHKNDNINKTQQTNETAPKNENEKPAEKKETVTKCETDDEDDLPLKVTQKLKLGLKTIVTDETETCAVDDECDALKEAREKLLKDVKVVLEKLETGITNNLSMDVPEKDSVKVINMETNIPLSNSCIKNNTKVTNNIETKLSTNITNNMETNIPPSNSCIKNNTKVTNNMETKLSTNIKLHNIENNATLSKNLALEPKVNNIPKVKISSRLTFEEEIDDICNDEVIKDLTNNCLVDMNLFDEPWLDDLANSIAEEELVNLEDDIILIDDDEPAPVEPNIVTEVMDVEYDSTHHDELIKPGVYRCKRCPDIFPTRFNQIQHEMQHIRIKKPRPLLCEYCDRFFATKQLLKTHLTSKHSKHYRLRAFQTCKKCNLKYSNYDRHLEIYHVLLRCHLCNEGFETEVDRLNHIRAHLIKTKCSQCDYIASGIEILEHQKLFHKISVCITKTFNLCDVCCLFLKNKNNTQYTFGESVSKVGERLYCEHCGKLFFNLTQVTRFGKGRMKDSDGVLEKKKKACSNKERLKNIQKRLQMINKLSRF